MVAVVRFAVAPSPNVQLNDVIVFPDVALLVVASKLTTNGATPFVGVATKFADGFMSSKYPAGDWIFSGRVPPSASSTRTQVFGGEDMLLVEQPGAVGQVKVAPATEATT